MTYLFVVNLQMLLEIGTGCELLVADFTDVGLLSSMYALMADKVRYLYLNSCCNLNTKRRLQFLSNLRDLQRGDGYQKEIVRKGPSYLRESLVATFVLTAVGLFLIVNSCVLL